MSRYVKHRDGKWVVLQKGTGKVLSTHDTEHEAKDSLAAMHVHHPKPYPLHRKSRL